VPLDEIMRLYLYIRRTAPDQIDDVGRQMDRLMITEIVQVAWVFESGKEREREREREREKSYKKRKHCFKIFL